MVKLYIFGKNDIMKPFVRPDFWLFATTDARSNLPTKVFSRKSLPMQTVALSLLAGNLFSMAVNAEDEGKKVLLIKGNPMLMYQLPALQQEEISTQAKILSEMGHTLTTIDEPNVTQEVLKNYDLIIYNNAGWAGYANQLTFDMLRQVHEENNIPLYFLGDDTAFMLAISSLKNDGLTLFQSTWNNGYAQTINLDQNHPIGQGVQPFYYYKDIDVTSVFSSEVTTIGTTSSGLPVIVAYDGGNCNKITAQLVNVKTSEIVIADSSGLASLEKLYENSISWLLDCSKPIYTAFGTLLGKTGKPLAGATIHLGEYTAITDKNGNWSISDLVAGDYLVVASKGDNADECGIARILDNGQYQQQVDSCTVTYGDNNASVIAIWQSVNGNLQYVDTVTVEAFDVKFQEGRDYKIVDGAGEYVLEGIDDAGNTTSKVNVVRIQ